ncbi:MAG: Holliday junction branch migration DNA helicase RuvB [Candidatus Omnitrophica bacterium]|nr:Holliday junction branch migration DNA helicase RuvB [Candidatus Omnitrophota bacterium]
MTEERLVDQIQHEEDALWEAALRPQTFSEFIGQAKLKENLAIYTQAALKRKEPLDHVLLFGPPGLGKTTLAHIIAKTMSANIRSTSGPVLERPGDLAGLLTNLKEGDVLFIDEIHRISHVVEEYLYPAMEDFSIDIMIDKGPNARSVKINIPPFTLIGATTRSGLLTAPLRSRFGIVEHLDYYFEEDLRKIIRRSANILKVEMESEGAHEISRRARGTPRVANRLLRRVRDFAEIKAQGKIDQEVANHALGKLEVDSEGLDAMDKKILEYIMNECEGGPVGIASLAVGVGEESETLEEIYEPYLIQRGFLKRTASGRMATRRSYEHFKRKPPVKTADLF